MLKFMKNLSFCGAGNVEFIAIFYDLKGLKC